MNIMNKLTLKHIRANWKRTFLTIVGIILSVAMFTAVSTGVTSCLKWMENITLEDTGKWQINYKNVPLDKVSILEKEEDTEILMLAQTKGYGKLEGFQEKLKERAKKSAKPYLYLSAYDTSAFTDMPVSLVKGRFPEKENEIVLPQHLLEDMNTPYAIGDTITMDMGKRMLVTEASKEDLSQIGIEEITVELGQDKEYLGEKKEYKIGDKQEKTVVVGENFEMSGETKQYTIVGIIAEPGLQMEYPKSPGYTVLTYLDRNKLPSGATVDAYVYRGQVTTAVYDESLAMAKRLGIVSNMEATKLKEVENIEVNQSVLYYSGVTPNDEFNMFLKVLSGILNVIIMVGSISLIYNSFSISISERSKQLGMLSSVGATKKQKRNSVLLEATFLGIIGIPLGVLAGILGLSITFKLINPLFIDMINTPVELAMYFSPKSILIAVLFAIATIFISAYIPARRASKITPMEAIRQSKDVKITSKSVKTSRLTKKIFGLEGEIALKNMKRNKKRYRSLIFSLFISVVLFISVAAYIHYMSEAFAVGKGESNFDVYVSSNDIPKEEFYEIAEELREYDSVKQVAVSKSEDFDLSGKQKVDIVSSKYSDMVEKEYKTTYTPHFMVVGLDEQGFNQYCETLKINPKEIHGSDAIQGILINYYRIHNGYSIQDYVPLNVSEGQELSLELTSGDDTKKKESVTFNVAKVTKELPLGIMTYGAYYDSPVYLVVPMQTLEKLQKENSADKEEDVSDVIYMLANDKEQIGKDLEKVMTIHDYAEHDYDNYNMIELEKVTRQLILAMSVFAYGFIILMSLICCANMCNTISTSIALRRKEFSMLRSIGMTPSVFRRMIMYESLLYGIKALLYGIPVSLLVAYGIYRSIAGQIAVGFALPINIFIIAIVVVFAVVGMAMAYSSRKVRKATIIDGLKDDIM